MLNTVKSSSNIHPVCMPMSKAASNPRSITLSIIGANYEEQRAISWILTRPLLDFLQKTANHFPSIKSLSNAPLSLMHPEAMVLCVLTIEIKICHPWRIQKRRDWERESEALLVAHIDDDERERAKAEITPLDTTNFAACIIALWWKSLHLNIQERQRMWDREARRECYYFAELLKLSSQKNDWLLNEMFCLYNFWIVNSSPMKKRFIESKNTLGNLLSEQESSGIYFAKILLPSVKLSIHL